MKSQILGKSDLLSSRLSYGCMRITRKWNPAEITAEDKAHGKVALSAAFESGYNLFDHADIYARGACESLFGEWLSENPGVREQLIVATKCGIRFGGDPEPESPHRYDFSKEHILWSCDASLKRMGIETIDLYQLHRPDLLMHPAEIAEAFEILHSQGKVRWFGVSNFSPSFVTALQSAMDRPLIVNQVEIHLARLDPFVDGTLDQCLAETITPLAWSPLAGGRVGDRANPDPKDGTLPAIVEQLDAIAAKLGVSRSEVAVAWLLKHPSQIVPIIGSTNPETIQRMAGADQLDLDREDWYRLLLASRGKPLP